LGLTQQYYFRESDGRLTKVVGDTTWGNQANPKAPGNPGTPPVANARPNTNVGAKPTPPKVSNQVKEKMEASRKANQKKTAEKSKANKKTVKGL
jgi:hypothetical protein